VSVLLGRKVGGVGVIMKDNELNLKKIEVSLTP
jgi:hypothetical protein